MPEFEPAHQYPDVFDGSPLNSVLAEQVPNGVETVLLSPEGQVPLTFEVVSCYPPNTVEAGHPSSTALDDVMVALPGFGVQLQDKNHNKTDENDVWTPNHHVLRHAALARALEKTVIGFSAPGTKFTDKLSRQMRREIRTGNFRSLTNYYAKHLADLGVKSVTIDGYSMGGALTPDMIESCLERGIEVNQVLLGAVANAIEDKGAIQLGKRHLSGTGNKAERYAYAESSPALLEEVEQHRTKVYRGIGARAVKGFTTAKRISTVSTSTPRALALGLAYGRWLPGPIENPALAFGARMKKIMLEHPEIAVELYTGGKDVFAPLYGMENVAEILGKDLKIYPKETHALRDKLWIISAFALERLRKN